MRLVITSSKGGAGKSTTAVTLARLMAASTRPLLLDIDPQKASKAFQLDGVEVVCTTPQQAAEIAGRAGNRPVIVDCPNDIPKSEPVIEVATLVIVPAPMDFLALRGSVMALRDLIKRNIPARLLITLYEPGNPLHKEGRGDVRSSGVPQFATTIYRRRVVSDATRERQTVVDFAPLSQSTKQFQYLLEEIWQEQT